MPTPSNLRRCFQRLTTLVMLQLSLLPSVSQRRPSTEATKRVPRRVQALKGSAGDVPGWVMVTLMSALLVAGIYAIAGPALISMFTNAINKVGGLQ